MAMRTCHPAQDATEWLMRSVMESDGPEESQTDDISSNEDVCSMIHLTVTTFGVINHLLLKGVDCNMLVLKATDYAHRQSVMERLVGLTNVCACAVP